MLITASHCSSFMRTITLSRVMPALLTRMSSLPHSLTTSSTTSPTRSLLVTSQAIGSAVPPAARMAATVSARLSALMSMQATLAPAAASDLGDAPAQSACGAGHKGHLPAQIGRNSACHG